MKRHGAEGGDYNRGGYSKRQKGDGFADAIAAGKFELRLLVSSKSAGAVIGKGGDNIKRLRSQFDANVSVPDSQAPERVLTVVCAVENVEPLCREMVSRLDDSAGDGKKEVKLVVHQSHAGAIIGKSGSKIKELREETNVNIKVFSGCAPQSTDRIVQMIGSESNMPGAIKAIVDHLKNIPIKGPSRQYDPINYDPSMLAEYGGFPLDRNAGPPSRYGGGGSGGMGGGHRGGPPMGGGPRGPMGGGGYGGPPMALPLGGGYQPFHGGPQPTSTQQVTIPTELGGTIIGRGGDRINRIRDESGAQIVLEPSQPGHDERIITITGTQQQIHAAQYLLQQCVRQSLMGGGGPGGGPGGPGMRDMSGGNRRFR